MDFREIDNYDYVFEKVPFAISSIFKWKFEDGKMHQRFLKLNGSDYKSFVPFLDWRDFKEQMSTRRIFDENGEIFTNESIENYCKAYSDGFVKGYNDLESEIKDTTSIFKTNNEEIAKKVFSIIHTTFYPFSGNRTTLYLNDEDNKEFTRETLTIKSLRESGAKIGRNYKAWFFILNNPDLFIELFKPFYLEIYKLIEKDLKKRNSHYPNYQTDLQKIIDEFEVLPKLKFEPPKTPTFEGLFNELYKDRINEFVGILKYENELKKSPITPLINDNNEWIGTQAKLAYIFYHCLLNEGIVRKVTTKELTTIFSTKFKNIPYNFCTNGKEAFTDQETDYKNMFDEKIKALK